MIIYIDESGTHRHDGHSTTAVVYIEVMYDQDFNNKIREIEEELRLNSFHWSEERWIVREKFLSKIAKLDFSAKVAIFKNPVKQSKMMEVVFGHLITEGRVRNIFLDGKKPKWYELSLKKALRDKGISVKKLKTANDQSQPGIQVADCLAGLVRRHYDSPNEENPKKWFEKLKRSGKLTMQLLFET